MGSNMAEANKHMIRLTYLRNKKNSIKKKYGELADKVDRMENEMD